MTATSACRATPAWTTRVSPLALPPPTPVWMPARAGEGMPAPTRVLTRAPEQAWGGTFYRPRPVAPGPRRVLKATLARLPWRPRNPLFREETDARGPSRAGRAAVGI